MESKCELLQFVNCKLVRDGKIVIDDLWVRNGKIIDPEKVFFDEKNIADVQINCQGALISPGFIDLQINGAFGIDFSQNLDDVKNGLMKVAKGLLAHGVTSFCPTIVTSPKEVYAKVLPLLEKHDGGMDGATILGAHIEGPFINVDKKGAHPPKCIRSLENGFDTLIDMYGSLDNVCILTLAPEIKNALPVIKRLKEMGITVSVGHSTADLFIGEEAVHHGASFITHLFNAMLPFHHRDPGLVGLLASKSISRPVSYGLITDGIHTHPAAVRIAWRTHPKGLVLVTDAISAMGLQEGTHSIGQLAIEIKGDRAVVAGTDTLCGSIAPMHKCIQYFREATACSIVSALEVATLHPARTIGLEKKKGTLNYGADADFVFLDDNLDVLSTWIAGECVYSEVSRPQHSVKYLNKLS